jgi:hypothetical protein
MCLQKENGRMIQDLEMIELHHTDVDWRASGTTSCQYRIPEHFFAEKG